MNLIMNKIIASILFISTLPLVACTSNMDITQQNPFTFTPKNTLPVDEVLRLTHHTFFNYDSFSIDESSASNILAHAKFLVNHPNTRIQVEGHADDKGSDEYNRALGLQRAESVTNLLRTYGVKEDQIILRSYSEDKPLSRISDSLNRRATIIY